MKLLLILMIILSFVGLPISVGPKGTFILYNAEFSGTFDLIKAGLFSTFQTIVWVCLLLTHAGIISLIFLTNNSNFMRLLMWLPLLFLMLYSLLQTILILILLLPFIIVWIIVLFKSDFNARKPA